MRPKSMATGVVALLGTAARSSTPSDSLVTRASVRKGMISETDPTRVVLPTPKPPATRVLVGAAERWALERTESTEGPFDELSSLVLRRIFGQGRLNPDVSLLDQVTQEDPDHTDRHVHVRGHLGDRAFVAFFENA